MRPSLPSPPPVLSNNQQGLPQDHPQQALPHSPVAPSIKDSSRSKPDVPVRGSSLYKAKCKDLCAKMKKCRTPSEFARVLSQWQWFQWLSTLDNTSSGLQLDTEAEAQFLKCASDLYPKSWIDILETPKDPGEDDFQFEARQCLAQTYRKMTRRLAQVLDFSSPSYVVNDELDTKNVIRFRCPNNPSCHEGSTCSICTGEIDFKSMGVKARIEIINHPLTFIFPSTIDNLPLLKHEKKTFNRFLESLWKRNNSHESDEIAWQGMFCELFWIDGGIRSLTCKSLRWRLEVICCLIRQSIFRYLSMSIEDRAESERAHTALEEDARDCDMVDFDFYQWVEHQLLEVYQSKEAPPPKENVGNELAVETTCGHVFGLECIKEWLDISTTCPMCRNALATEKPSWIVIAGRKEVEDEGLLRGLQKMKLSFVMD